jgi:glutathione S-transferase
MLRIYGYAESINVRKVLWTCSELDLDFVREDWGTPLRPTSDPVFLSLNPVGMVPVVDDNGTIIWESNTILRYLSASRDRDDLLPVDPAHRARVEMWMDWQASDFNNSWRIAFQGLVRKNPDHKVSAIEQSMTNFSRMVGIVDAQLARSGGYICGTRFSLADIPIGLSIHRWRSLPADNKPRFASVDRYYERLCERPGFRQFGLGGGP